VKRRGYSLSARIAERTERRALRSIARGETPDADPAVAALALREAYLLAACHGLADPEDRRVAPVLRRMPALGETLLLAPAPHRAAWSWAISAAACLRDPRVATLGALDFAAVRAAAHPASHRAWRSGEALGIALLGREAGAAIDAAREAWADAGAVLERWARDIALPQLEVLRALMDEDQPAFDAALLDAVRAHARFYSRGPEARDPRGQLALELTAIACVADDRGLAVDVDSGYLPRSLVEPT